MQSRVAVGWREGKRWPDLGKVIVRVTIRVIMSDDKSGDKSDDKSDE